MRLWLILWFRAPARLSTRIRSLAFSACTCSRGLLSSSRTKPARCGSTCVSMRTTLRNLHGSRRSGAASRPSLSELGPQLCGGAALATASASPPGCTSRPSVFSWSLCCATVCQRRSIFKPCCSSRTSAARTSCARCLVSTMGTCRARPTRMLTTRPERASTRMCPCPSMSSLPRSNCPPTRFSLQKWKQSILQSPGRAWGLGLQT
mmetsp:Transcript_20349/g.47557  ORF Transcript_20349/g.47557 Transcript_20349/m.47557 type:complete len:206 (-) Transcript_20349:96-713(-)